MAATFLQSLRTPQREWKRRAVGANVVKPPPTPERNMQCKPGIIVSPLLALIGEDFDAVTRVLHRADVNMAPYEPVNRITLCMSAVKICTVLLKHEVEILVSRRSDLEHEGLLECSVESAGTGLTRTPGLWTLRIARGNQGEPRGVRCFLVPGTGEGGRRTTDWQARARGRDRTTGRGEGSRAGGHIGRAGPGRAASSSSRDRKRKENFPGCGCTHIDAQRFGMN